MNRSIPLSALAMAALMTCLALAGPVAAVGDLDDVNAPCEYPGNAGTIAQTGNVAVPWWGYYWEGSSIRFAGDSYNAAVYKWNYDLAGRCVPGVNAGVNRGPSTFCPAPGRAGSLASASAFVAEDAYWGPGGHLYLRGYDQTTTAYGKNNAAGFSCAGTVEYDQSAPARRDICLTCRPAISTADALP